MSNEPQPFSGEDDDPILRRIVEGLLSKGKSIEQIERHMEATLPESTRKSAQILLKRLKAGARAMLSEQRRFRRGFQRRQREKWGKPLDLLLMLLEAACEAGEAYNEAFRDEAAAEQDFVFDALHRLHGRACLVTGEILWLMEGGYPSGAMARWRTLHEIAVVGRFLREMGKDVAEKYLLHHVIDTCKTAEEFQKHCGTPDYEPFTATELDRMRADRDKLCQRFGKEYKQPWGWAAEALKPKSANFTEIESAVSLSNQRPYFKLASHSNHAGSKGIQFDLGNVLNPAGSDTILAGPSDAGLFEPGTCTAISFLQVTMNLLTYRDARLTALISLEALDLLTDEILESFAAAEAALAAKTDAIRRGNTPQSS